MHFLDGRPVGILSGLLQLPAVTTTYLSRQADATYQKLPDRPKGCARAYIGLCLSKSERL